MKIIYHPRMPKAERLVLGTILDAHDQRLLPSELQKMQLPAIEIGKAHAIREMSLQDLAKGGELADASLIGVRYLLRDGNATSAAVDLTVDGGDRGSYDADAADRCAEVHSLITGEYVRRIDQTLQRIEAAAAKGAKGGALSLLRCRGLNLDALVIEPEDGSAAQISPLPDRAMPLRERMYGEGEFFDALQPEAERLLDAYARDSGEGREG